MELDKKELTEFAELVRSNPDKKIESIVKGYMDYNSVNSEAPNETPNVNNNEAKEEQCHYFANCRNSGKNQYCYDHRDNDIICYK